MAIWGLLAAAIPALVGALANSKEASTNRNFQANMMDAQMQNSWAMYKDSQQYSTPSNQVQRLKDAGLNPTMAMQNITTGNVESSPNVGLPSGAQAHHDLAGITDDLLSIVGFKNEQKLLEGQTRKLHADATLQEIDSYSRFQENMLKLYEILSKTDKNKADALLSRVTADATDFLSTAQYNKLQSEVATNASQNEINWITYAKGMKELEYLPTHQRLDYVERMANIANMKADTAESKQRKIKLIQETNWTYFKSQGEKFVNSLNKKVENYLIRQAQKKSWTSNPYEMLNSMGDYLDSNLPDLW